MHVWGKISVCGVLAGIALLGITFQPVTIRDVLVIAGRYGVCFFAFSLFLHKIWFKCVEFVPAFVVLRTSFSLGLTISIGAVLVSEDFDIPFGLYMCVMSFFHYSEFLVISIINPTTLSVNSFLLNRRKLCAIGACCAEYFIESIVFPDLKSNRTIMYFGLAVCILGEIVRKVAMFTAWRNFTHYLRHENVEGHVLITSGVYSVVRHPSYVGWFWWSIGNQVLLMNPFSTVVYTLVNWRYLTIRIPYEERTLLSFFGKKYLGYQTRVNRTGVPFVKGHE